MESLLLLIQIALYHGIDRRHEGKAAPEHQPYGTLTFNELRRQGGISVFGWFCLHGGIERGDDSVCLILIQYLDVDHRGACSTVLDWQRYRFDGVVFSEQAEVMAADAPTLADFTGSKLSFTDVSLHCLWMDAEHLRDLINGVVVFHCFLILLKTS